MLRRIYKRQRGKKKTVRDYELEHRTPIQKLKKAVTIAKRAVRSETRYYVQALAAGAIPQAGNSTLLNGMQQGDVDGSRSAGQIRMLGCRIHLGVYMPANTVQGVIAGGASASTCIRVMLVYDRQSNGAAFTNATLLYNNANDANNYTCPLNLRNKQRFKVLFDKNYNLDFRSVQTNAVGQWAAYNPVKSIRIRKRFSLPTFYKDGANVGDVTDIARGALYLITYSFDGTSMVTQQDTNLVLIYDP